MGVFKRPAKAKKGQKQYWYMRCQYKGREKKTAAEQEVFDLLTRRELSKAARTLASYEATQVFPRGAILGVGGEILRGEELREDVTKGAIRDLEVIFSETPGILKGIDTSRLEKLRVATGMMLLSGHSKKARSWLPDGFETGIHLDGDVAARMLVFYASRKRDIETYKEMGVKNLEVWTVGDDCPECREISGKKYLLANAPELPHPKCTSKMRCRCSINALFD